MSKLKVTCVYFRIFHHCKIDPKVIYTYIHTYKFVSRFAEKVTDGFAWKFWVRLDLAQFPLDINHIIPLDKIPPEQHPFPECEDHMRPPAAWAAVTAGWVNVNRLMTIDCVLIRRSFNISSLNEVALTYCSRLLYTSQASLTVADSLCWFRWLASLLNRRIRSDVTELNWHGLVFDELTNGRARRVRAPSRVIADAV